MKLLHRVLFKEQCFLLMLILGSILFLALTVRFLQFGERFIGQSLTVIDTFELLMYLTPFFLFLLIPMACMLSVFLTYLRMNSDRELVALKSNGIGLYSILPSTLLLCLICTSVHVIVSFHGIGWGMNNFYEKIMDIARTRTQVMIQPGVFNTTIPNLVIYTKQVDSQTNEMSHVFVKDTSQQDLTTVITAEKANIVNDLKNLQLLFVFDKGQILRRDKQDTSMLNYSRYIVKMDLRKIIGWGKKRTKKPTEMTWSTLHKLRSSNELDPEALQEIKTEQSKRILMPLSSIILGLFSLPLAFIFQGVKRHFAVIFSLMALFLYYSIFSVGASLASAGVIHPVLGLWLPNGLLLMGALWGLHLTNFERKPTLPKMISFLNRKQQA